MILTPLAAPERSHRSHPLGAAFAVASLFVLLAGSPAHALTEDDPNLDQSIESGQAVAAEPVTLSAGHVDIGPRFIDGDFTLLVHDDASKADANAQSVWRQTEQTVLQVTDASLLTVPDDPAYSFLGSEPGAEVYVVPQTQNPDVVWVGWNTQDPEVMDLIQRGVTLSLTQVEGPGELVVYLQSGDFSAPDVLWDSRILDAQPAWIDVNTHTHANWVFSEPGVYLVQLQITADLLDGTQVSDTRELRFAIGDATDTQAAFTAQLTTDADARLADTGASSDADGAEAAASALPSDPLVLTLVIALVVVALGLGGGFTVIIMRGRAAKRHALATSEIEARA